MLVLTRDSALEFLSEATVAPITSTIRNIPTELLLGEGDGMRAQCAVNFDHVQTVGRDNLGALIAELDPRRWDEAERALLFSLGFNRTH